MRPPRDQGTDARLVAVTGYAQLQDREAAAPIWYRSGRAAVLLGPREHRSAGG